VAGDITNAILDALISAFTLELSVNIEEDDDLRLKHISKYPFQQDPTEVAPYVWVAPSLERGRVDDPVHDDDIGGGSRWLNFFHVRGRIPQQATKEEAYDKIGRFNRRVIRALRKHWNLGDVEADDGEFVTFCDPRLIDENFTKVFGGEVEWFGELRIDLHFFSEEPEEDWGG
jgi:hypothetical protein